MHVALLWIFRRRACVVQQVHPQQIFASARADEAESISVQTVVCLTKRCMQINQRAAFQLGSRVSAAHPPRVKRPYPWCCFCCSSSSCFCHTSSHFRHLFHRRHHKETIKTNEHAHPDGNTHLEGNVIIFVNRSASLQDIFRRPVFTLLVRQRCLPRGHRSDSERSAGSRAGARFSSRCVRERRARCLRDLRRSVRVSASLQPLCTHCARGHQKTDHRALPRRERERGGGRRERAGE